ncbi:MAG: IMPACT family protein [Anaerolineae bacterium]|nr:YigZ family protein [Chloroflexota bacterium]
MTVDSPALLRYTVPHAEAQAEIVVKKSIFIGSVGRAASAEQARAFIATVCERYPDANHHAWAYIISGGPQAEIGSSDDGEPGGTAGRPMLAVLEGEGLLEAVAVGTRYWGGIKLGTGGLVRAYGDCVRQALKQLPVADMVYHYLARVTVPYPLYGSLKYGLPRSNVLVDAEQFGDAVTLDLAIPPAAFQSLADALQELSNGATLLAQCVTGGRYVYTPRQ